MTLLHKNIHHRESVCVHLCKIALVHILCVCVHIPMDSHQKSVSIQEPVRLFRCPFPFCLMFSCSCRIAVLHGLNLRSREEQNKGSSMLTEHKKVCITKYKTTIKVMQENNNNTLGKLWRMRSHNNPSTVHMTAMNVVR